MRPRSTASDKGESVNKFMIKVARIERANESRADPQVCITFQIKCGEVGFQMPIHLSVSDYDDTEMVQAARSALHRMFVGLAAQSRKWNLSAKDLRRLSSMSSRPGKKHFK
jgi:hypothetical protein